MNKAQTLQVLEENFHKQIHSTIKKEFENIPKGFVEGLFSGFKQMEKTITKEQEEKAQEIVQNIQKKFRERASQHTDTLMKSIYNHLMELSLLVHSITK